MVFIYRAYNQYFIITFVITEKEVSTPSDIAGRRPISRKPSGPSKKWCICISVLVIAITVGVFYTYELKGVQCMLYTIIVISFAKLITHRYYYTR